MPDGKSAKKVIKGVLKQHKKGLSIEGLKKDVCKQLEAEGMTSKKAEKAFDAKIQLPIFEVKAGVARLVKNKDGDAAVAEPPKAEGKRKQAPAAESAPAKKKASKNAASAPPPAQPASPRQSPRLAAAAAAAAVPPLALEGEPAGKVAKTAGGSVRMKNMLRAQTTDLIAAREFNTN